MTTGKKMLRKAKDEGMKTMRDLLCDKSEARSGWLSGWMRCAIMRIFTVGVFNVSAPWTAPEKEHTPKR